jgi:hypothetical protein
MTQDFKSLVEAIPIDGKMFYMRGTCIIDPEEIRKTVDELLAMEATMTYDQAVDAAKTGKKVQLLGWNDESFAVWRQGKLMARTGNTRWCEIQDLDTLSDKWRVIS